jgi:hypothetical protein
MKPLVLFILILLFVFSGYAKEITIQSPDRRLAVTLSAGERLSLSARDGSMPLFSLPSLGLVIRGETPFGARAAVTREDTGLSSACMTRVLHTGW